MKETQEQPRLCKHGYNWNTCSLCYKPAATGSGEPRECEWCQGTGVALAGHPDARCTHCNGTCYTAPTPPASQPTVTLDKVLFNKTIEALECAKTIYSQARYLDSSREIQKLLAQLRAAEQQNK